MSDMSLSPFRGQQTAEEILEPSPLSKLRRRIFKNHSFLIGAVILILISLYQNYEAQSVCPQCTGNSDIAVVVVVV